jgi:Transposase DDE domain
VARTPKTRRSTRHARSMASCLRQFLTPQVWKQARRGLKKLRKDTRWDFHHLVLVLLALTWSLGDSTPERFEMALPIVATCRPKRRRAGRTAPGFQKALCRLPMRPLVALAAAIRGRLTSLLGDDLLHDGFIPLGCDGSRLECCRNDELIARMGKAGKDGSSPSMWVTAVVHLTTGVPWSWWLGKGDASERDHLRRLLPSLPKRALVVADAGYDGYDLATSILGSGASFLIRMSSKSRLLVDRPVAPGQFRQGPVSYWPERARQAGLPPLRSRLIRVRARRRGKEPKRGSDVWLLTDVVAGRMSMTQAGSFYRLRWENEGLFRSYKRTLSKVHLVGRTVRSVHREAYGSLLACQLLLAQGAWALRGARDRATAVAPCSARKAILAVREGLKAAMKPDRRVSYRDRLARCRRERRKRTSPKLKREWPQRTPHRPPKPPLLLTMNEKEKALLSRLNAVA